MEESVNAENEVFTAPEEFKKIIDEFTNDLKGTFPDETEEKISLLYKNDELDYESIYKHCQSVYPERFFDILYQNEDMFKSDDYNFNFLPEIDFKILWELQDVSQQTKATIWKYLQLILFSTVGNMEDGKSFGELYEKGYSGKAPWGQALQNMQSLIDEVVRDSHEQCETLYTAE